MMATDMDALICDFAETYGIIDMEALPVDKLAVLSCGLRENSRIRMKMAGAKTNTETFLLAGCFDMLSWIKWSKTQYAADGGPPPTGILQSLLGQTSGSETVGFRSADEYEAARERIIREANHGY